MLKRVAATKVLHLAELIESVARFHNEKATEANTIALLAMGDYFLGLADGEARCARELRRLVEEDS